MEAEIVKYDITLSGEEAGNGTKKVLTRNGKNLEVTIAPGTKDASIIKLTNALQVTDGRPGDILITIRIKQGGSKEGVIAVTDGTFESEVLSGKLPVLVDFWAAWCGPCKMVSPVIDKLSGEFSGRMKFCKVNVDENPKVAGQFQVMSIPTLLFFRNGQVVDKAVGAQPEQALRSRIETVLQ